MEVTVLQWIFYQEKTLYISLWQTLCYYLILSSTKGFADEKKRSILNVVIFN